MKLNFSKEDFNKNKDNIMFNEDFVKNDFPNKRKENWKFTDLEKILNFKFKELSVYNKKNTITFDEKLQFDHYYLISINGNISKYNFGNGEKKFSSSSKFDTKDLLLKANKIHPFNNFTQDIKNDTLLAQNIAFADRGYNLELASSLSKPIVIYNIFKHDLENKFINISNEIKLLNSDITVIEYNIDYSNSSFFRSTFQNFDLNKSNLNYFIINKGSSKSYNYVRNKIKIDKSNYENYIFTSGTKFKKEDSEISLNSEDSSAKIMSAVFLKNDDHQEIQSTIRHKKPNCKSFQKIKNILKDGSKGIFQGKVHVSKEAQKTDAYQISKGLLLDQKSEFSTKPELEIYADDVKCSHGSTSGNIDEQAQYYLMSRGLSKKNATRLIVKGFLADVISEIKNKDLKKIINSHLDDVINYEN